MRRRDFIRGSACSGSILLFWETDGKAAAGRAFRSGESSTLPPPSSRNALPDLHPARWIWYPSGRCLQNTFVLFRRSLDLRAKPRRANGWIVADSRYLLEVNGQRIQWGPAPCDPRWLEVDPMDLSSTLNAGPNVIGVTALFFGQGDGTWPVGKPGFLFWLEIESEEGAKQMLVSDASWLSFLARAWKPGQYKRWYLRSLQEEFDARLYPYGWTRADFAPSQDWLRAMELECPADRPPICSSYDEYMLQITGDRSATQLRARSVPHMRESFEPAKLAESLWMDWVRPSAEYFEYRTPEAFRADRRPSATETAPGEWRVQLEGARGAALTFEFQEQMLGWPRFTIDAPAGTIVELMVQEAHEVGGPALLNTHFDSWARFICREGVNRFETFDYECCRWMQLHIHGAPGVVTVRDVGMRRRVFPWPNPPQVRFAEPALQRLMDAAINTLNNSAQETLMDGAGRERQQYSGDGAHQLHSVHLTFGETHLPARFVTTFSQGMTADGYFLDCWPAYDRLARLFERELQLTNWGPLLDHGVGFNFDCFYHYMYSGNLEDLREPYPRLLRFAQYLESKVGRDGLLPVENLGLPSVWMDHIAYQRQRHKQCAFNLYAAAMLQHALAPICRAFGDTLQEQAARTMGEKIEAAAVRRFWDRERKVFVNNLPWLEEEKAVRMCDRSLATAILFDQCPEGRTEAALQALVTCPPEMGFSYPANAGWRLWALAKGGRADMVVKDFRERWATMESVRLNNTLQEDWHALPDSGSEWSHCPVAPLYVTHMSLAGIRPLEPGFKRCEIRPQMADLELLELTTYTPLGPLVFSGRGPLGDRELGLTLPPGCEGELVVRREETLPLERLEGPAPAGHIRYRLPAARKTMVHLKLS